MVVVVALDLVVVDAAFAVDAGAAVVAVVVDALLAVEERAVVADVAADVSTAADATELVVAGALSASHPVITAIPVAPVAPVIRRARRAGCGRRRFVSMEAIIQPQSEDKLGARWASASIRRSAVSPPTAAVAMMNAVRSRNVSLSLPAVTP